MSLLDKIKKNSTIKESSVLATSKFFNEKDVIPTAIHSINIALSGSLDGGLVPSLTQFCGKSKHFKTTFSLLCAKAYLDKYPESVLIFYDSEFGSPQSYFSSIGIDLNRTFHVPITNIEELKFDIMQQLSNIERGDKVVIVVDSIGNLASKKEVDDALEGKGAADMTRAKQLKSLFRMVTPHLTLKDIPMVVVNHIYSEIGLYPKDIVSGGTGSYLSADNIFIIGRQQEKEGTDIVGYDFIIKVEKSRYVKEGSKIPVSVKFDGGVSKFSGLMDLALESGHCIKPKNGWYAKIDVNTGEVIEKNYRLKDTDNNDFWKDILKDHKFKLFIEKKYKVAYGNILGESDEISNEDISETFSEEE